jgi:predicted transcriptional regulator
MKRDRIITETEKELNANGYSTVLASNMHTCADVFAERLGRKFVIKIVYNIDSVTRKEAESLSKLSEFLDAEPLILASFSKNAKLRPNINYRRFSITCISPETLPELSLSVPSLFASKSVGIKAKIDSSKLQRLRKTSDLRIAELAQKSRLSKATLYKHESNDVYAAIDTITRLENVLNGSIKSESVFENKKVKLHSNELARTGVRSLRLENAPFDIVAKKKNYYEISLDANIRTLIKRAALFKAIRDTFESNYPFFINKKGGKIKGIVVLKKEDLMKAASEEDLLNLVY